MILMLLDHVRETFYLHLQVSDPVNVFETSPELFYTRFVTFICAPVFIYLTGLSAWLFMKKNSRNETSKFLLKRGFVSNINGNNCNKFSLGRAISA